MEITVSLDLVYKLLKTIRLSIADWVTKCGLRVMKKTKIFYYQQMKMYQNNYSNMEHSEIMISEWISREDYEDRIILRVHSSTRFYIYYSCILRFIGKKEKPKAFTIIKWKCTKILLATWNRGKEWFQNKIRREH